MMKRIQSPPIPSAGTFFGGPSSSSDLVDEARMSSDAILAEFPSIPGRQQAIEKRPSERNMNVRNLAYNFPWSKRLAGLQMSNSFYGKKVDNESKQQNVPFEQGHQNKLDTLKSPPLYSIETNCKTAPSSFESDSSLQNHPSLQLLVPSAIPMPSSHDMTPLTLINKAFPTTSMDETSKRIPPASFPSSPRDCTVPSRGSINPHQYKQYLRKEISSVNFADRPQKPPRQISNITPSQPTPPRHQFYGEAYPNQQQPGQEQQQGPTHRRYQMRQWQQDSSRGIYCPHPQRILHNGPTSEPLNPSAFSRYSHDEMQSKQEWVSKSSSRLNDPSSLPPKSYPPTESRLISSAKSSSPAVMATRKKEVVHIEIFPGNSQILRGAEETMQALEQNFVTPCKCISCTVEHLCIADAAFVICPTCRCVSQAPGHALNEQYGVGLGFLPHYEQD
jgi:hypothetical protein